MVAAGGWNPHRGFRHDGLTDSLGCIGACVIARRIALLRAAIHPPLVRDVRGVFEWWAPEVGIRIADSNLRQDTNQQATYNPTVANAGNGSPRSAQAAICSINGSNSNP